MKFTPVGIDIAKSVFQVQYVDEQTGEVINRPLRRSVFVQHFVNRAPCLIGMEACSGAQHWARELIKLGHQVRLLPARFVKAFNIGNKNDAADARAIWLAVQQPGKAVALKTEAQQAVLARLSERLPTMLIESLREQYARLSELDAQIAQIERRLRQWLREDAAAQAVAQMPGVGLLTATAAVASMGDAKVFRSGRQFAAWAGLVPRQTGSGGKVQLHGISKRGDTYLRTLLIHGARSVLQHAKDPGPWVEQLGQRRPPNVVTVALANKMARTIWAVLAHGRAYQPGHVSVRPA